LTDYFFAGSRGTLDILDINQFGPHLSLVLFLLAGMAIVFFIALRRREAIRRKQTEESLRREHHALKHLLESSDHERQLIANEIHDGLAQQLAAANMHFEAFAHLKDTTSQQATKDLETGIALLRESHGEARRLIAGVRPPILDERGVVAAINHLVNGRESQNGTRVEFQHDVKFDRLMPILENSIYRIVQEGLANACRHSKSRDVVVELMQKANSLCIRIQDWGLGFNPADVPNDRFGLDGIRQRAHLLGGEATIMSILGEGTCVKVELPLLAQNP
jgi:signal transduction histidine kinase